MGFMQGLGRMLSGEPVFQPGDDPHANTREPATTAQQAEADTDTQTQTNPYQRNDGTKILPEVVFDRLSVNLSSDSSHVEIWGNVRNDSPYSVELNQLSWLGDSIDLNQTLGPGQMRQVHLYRGDTPKNNAYSNADLQIQVENGDLFTQRYYLEFDYQSSGYYVPEQLHVNLPARDI